MIIIKKRLSQRLPELKPLLDKRLAEIRNKELGIDVSVPIVQYENMTREYISGNAIMPIVGMIYFIFLILTGSVAAAYGRGISLTYLFLFLICVCAIFLYLRTIYYYIEYCSHIKTTKDEILGKNGYGVKLGFMKFSEIKEIWITQKKSIIYLKDINEKKFGILFKDEFVPLLQVLLVKAENCTRFDFNYNYIMRNKLSKRLPEIKLLLDKRLAEINKCRKSS